MKQVITIIILISIVLPVILVPVNAGAQLPSQIVPKECDEVDRVTGEIKTKCRVEHAVQLIVNVSKWILAIMGSVALAMFVYGGFLWITAAGKAEQISKGRSVLVNTVIALVIILGAFALVRFVGEAFGVDQAQFGQFLGS